MNHRPGIWKGFFSLSIYLRFKFGKDLQHTKDLGRHQFVKERFELSWPEKHSVTVDRKVLCWKLAVCLNVDPPPEHESRPDERASELMLFFDKPSALQELQTSCSMKTIGIRALTCNI